MRLARGLALAAVLAVSAAQAAPAGTPPVVQWCGGAEEAPADRTPDAVRAFQIHVIYAVPSGGPDRFAALVSPIATDVAAIDAWWRSQDPTRAPRFDLAAFDACPAAFARLDVSAVRLPHDAAFYASNQFELLRADLDAAGFTDPDKKYLVYYDGPPIPSPTGVYCGRTESGVLGGGRRAYSIVFLGGFCGATLGTGGPTTVTAAHELIHGLGALPTPASGPGPPHACPNDPGHPCDDPRDILYPQASTTASLDGLVLDSGRDDYYGHSGSWWDVRDSPFLARIGDADTGPPTAPSRFTATSRGSLVTLSWRPAEDDVGPVVYRVYRDGALLATSNLPVYRDTGAVAGATYRYAVRATDTAGFLSPRPSLRFTVGLGIVNANGVLVRDTVPPSSIGRIRPRATKTTVVLAWSRAHDQGGIRGYRVLRNGARYALVQRSPLRIPLARAHARWSIAAVDEAGNVGPASAIIVR